MLLAQGLPCVCGLDDVPPMRIALSGEAGKRGPMPLCFSTPESDDSTDFGGFFWQDYRLTGLTALAALNYPEPTPPIRRGRFRRDRLSGEGGIDQLADRPRVIRYPKSHCRRADAQALMRADHIV